MCSLDIFCLMPGSLTCKMNKTEIDHSKVARSVPTLMMACLASVMPNGYDLAAMTEEFMSSGSR